MSLSIIKSRSTGWYEDLLCGMPHDIINYWGVFYDDTMEAEEDELYLIQVYGVRATDEPLDNLVIYTNDYDQTKLYELNAPDVFENLDIENFFKQVGPPSDNWDIYNPSSSDRSLSLMNKIYTYGEYSFLVKWAGKYKFTFYNVYLYCVDWGNGLLGNVKLQVLVKSVYNNTARIAEYVTLFTDGATMYTDDDISFEYDLQLGDYIYFSLIAIEIDYEGHYSFNFSDFDVIFTETGLFRKYIPYISNNICDDLKSRILGGGVLMPEYTDVDRYQAAPNKKAYWGDLQWCSEGTLIYFTPKDEYPYYNKQEDAGNSQCVQLVRDLIIVKPIVVTADNGAIDGTATIELQSDTYDGYPSVMYTSVDSRDWRDFLQYSVSNVHTGLAAGRHVAYARTYYEDWYEISCEFDIPLSSEKVYGVKFRHEFDDLSENLWKIDILEREYSGSITEVDGGKSPLMISLKGKNKDKYMAIHGSEAVINLMSTSDFQFSGLFTKDHRMNQVKVYKDGSLYWTGYVIPDIYSEQYVVTPYEISLVATDGLADLKDVEFKADDGEFITGTKSIIEIIAICLNKLDLELYIYNGVNIFEENMDETDTDDPFTQAEINCQAFINLSCYEVIERLLKPFGARVMQAAGAWHITRITESNGPYKRRKFNYNAVYQSNNEYDPVKELDSVTKYLHQDQVLEIIQAYRKVDIKQDYGLKLSFLRNGEFNFKAFESDTVLSFWIYNNLQKPTIERRQHEVGEYCLAIVGFSTSKLDTKYIESLPVDIDHQDDYYLRFEIQYNVKSPLDKLENTKVQIQVIFESGGTVYYLDDTGAWSTNVNFIQVEVTSPNTWQTYQTGNISLYNDLDGEVKVRLHEAVSNDSDQVSDDRVTELLIKYARLYMLHDDNILDGSKDYEKYNSDKYVHVPDLVDVYFGDMPNDIDLDNIPLIYNNVMLVNSNRSYNWHKRGEDGYNNLADLLANDIIYNHKEQTLKITGTVNALTDFTQAIKDPQNSDKVFILAGCEFNVRMNEWDGEWFEVFSVLTGAYLKYSDINFVDYDGTNLVETR